jgi:hypothetical protein
VLRISPFQPPEKVPWDGFQNSEMHYGEKLLSRQLSALKLHNKLDAPFHRTGSWIL